MPKGNPAKLTSCACHDHRIGTREQNRQGFALDGRGCPVAKSFNASEDGRGKIERLKSSSVAMLGFVLWVAGEGQHGGGCVKWEAPSADWLEGRSSTIGDGRTSSYVLPGDISYVQCIVLSLVQSNSDPTMASSICDERCFSSHCFRHMRIGCWQRGGT